MNQEIACPLPDLAEALSPYIRSRQEVRNIRKAIDEDLYHQLGSSNQESVSRISTLYGHGLSAKLQPGSSSGVRDAYVNAVIAHQKAQARLCALKADLTAQQNTHGETVYGTKKSGSSQGAINLIREEQRQRRLQIIRCSIDELETMRRQSEYADTDTLLNRDGRPHMPLPVLKTSVQEISRAEIESRTLSLKQAVLRAHGQAEASKTSLSSEDIQAHAVTASERQKVSALRVTRDYMISWLEGELGKIPPDGEPHVTDGKATSQESSADGNHLTTEDVRASYLAYVSAREEFARLLNVALLPKVPGEVASHAREVAAPAYTKQERLPETIRAVDVLPYATVLDENTEMEASLMQQSAFVRRQMALSSAETQRLISRLADESHLVSPNSKDAGAWAIAAAEARQKDAETIESDLLLGEVSVHKAREVIE